MSNHHAHIDFSGEDWDRPFKFFDKSWVIASRHHPGLFQAMELNNRVFVFQLRDKQGKDTLLVYGAGGPTTIDAVRSIERETDVKTGWIVGNGGAHHMFLDLWYAGFADARVLVPAKRIPTTRNGIELQKKYAARWELMHGPRPAQIAEEFGDQIDIVIFDQLLHGSDQKAGEAIGSPTDHTSAPIAKSGFGLMKMMMKTMSDRSQPTDEVTLLHRASGLVVGGHNYQFSYRPKGHKPPEKFKMKSGGFPMGMLMNMMMPVGAFASSFEGQPQPVSDSKLHADEWNMVLGWDMRAWTSSHNPPTIVGPDLSTDELKTAIRASLAKSGEDDPSGARLKWNRKHKRA